MRQNDHIKSAGADVRHILIEDDTKTTPTRYDVDHGMRSVIGIPPLPPMVTWPCEVGGGSAATLTELPRRSYVTAKRERKGTRAKTWRWILAITEAKAKK